MNMPFYKLIQQEIKEKFKNSNIVIWYDLKNEFKQEFNLFDEVDINKIAYQGSFIELRHKIFLKDKDLTKKWLIYCNVESKQGFLTEYEYFGEIYIASVRDILEKKYKIDFGKFDLSTLEDRLNILKNLWDILPENTIRYLEQQTLDDIVLTNGFGYVDISKEYTILKYICEPVKYDLILEQAKIKEQFFEFIALEYGIDVKGLNDNSKIVEKIVENLFQSELIQKSRNKDIRPFGTELQNINKIMNCVQLLETWANHEAYKHKFVEFSKLVSEKHMVNILEVMELDELFSIEYLIGIEEILYKKVEIQILKKQENSSLIKEELITYLKGEKDRLRETYATYHYELENIDVDSLKNKLKELKVFVDIRRRYYFSKAKIFEKWNVLHNIFQILDLLYSFEQQLDAVEADIDSIIQRYEENSWWKIDQLYRKIQEDYSQMDDFIIKLLNLVDNKYHYQYLKPLNDEVANALEYKTNYDFNTDIQLDFWAKFISGADINTQIAVVIVDALRYEMGREIYSMINEVENKRIEPLISSIPSVTEYGMASLLPNGNTRLRIKEESNVVKIYSGYDSTPLNNKDERINYFLKQARDVGIVKNLGAIVDTPINSLKNDFSGKSRILIFSNEIDSAGHIEDSSIQLFPSLLMKVQSCIKKLLEIGVSKVLVVADHGFVLTSGLQDWMKVDLPKDMQNIVTRRRYSISRKKVEGNYITKSCYSANHDGEVYFNFPRGINIFPASGGTKFYHGGISLQELLVPIIIIEKESRQLVVEDKRIEGEQLSIIDFGISDSQTKGKQKEIPKSVKEQIEIYIKNEALNKRERKILELFLKASSYTDSEIQEICASDGIRFVSKSVMQFMKEFIEKLNEQGYDWIGFRPVGLAFEYYLK